MITDNFRVLILLCVVAMVGFGVDYASARLPARVEAGRLLVALVELAFGDRDLSLRIGSGVQVTLHVGP